MTFFNYKIISPKLISGVDYNLKQIEVRGFVFKELRAIASSNIKMWDTNAIIEYYGKSEVIRLIDKEDNIQPLTILNRDDLFILMYFVNILTSPDYKMTYSVICPECGNKITFDVMIDNIEYENQVPSEVPIYFNDFKVTLKRPSLKDLLEVDEFAEKSPYEKEDIVMASMMEVEPITDKSKEFVSKIGMEGLELNLTILDILTTKEIVELIDVIREMKPSIKPFDVECKCGFKTKTSIDIELKDILPTDGLEIFDEFRNISK